MPENKNGNGFLPYALAPEIIHALDLLGYQEPTEIQREVIPAVLEGRNVAARSRTGTGKTAAFGIPLCEKIVWEENLPQALVLEPSRELAVQVSNELFHIGRRKRLKVPTVFGGFPIDKQMRTIKQKSHIVVGTPGRVMDLIQRECLKLTGIRYLVIDEADLMLDMGFLEEVKQIMALLPKGGRVLLFSATLDEKVRLLVDEYMEDAVMIAPEPETEEEPAISQVVYRADPEEKYDLLKRTLILENPESCMIFCGTREMVNVLLQKLKRDRIFCGMIHGEMEQRERLKTVDAFRRGGFRFLIATDVAARGIDFDKIDLVVNYDFPGGRETYVHRIGRTGRNGEKGRAVSLLCESEERMLHMVEAYMGRELSVTTCPEPDEEATKAFWTRQRERRAPKAQKGAALNAGITRLSIGGGRKSKMRAVDIVGTICSIDGIGAEDIGIIDIRESLTYVEILNGKGQAVLEKLQEKTIKGRLRKVRIARR
ncbi:DEAD/DEAH box helicase [Hungatella sp.]|uniref:DEAD/DEAH box helicase n=1 Tax=Hungatella sp. TaxID=2613924 RepID=UPI003AB45B72